MHWTLAGQLCRLYPVPKVHKKSWQEFIKELELCPLRHARDYWTRERVCQNTLEYARLSGPLHCFQHKMSLMK